MFDDICRFHWLVHYPTITVRPLEAMFYSEYPLLTQWTVCLMANRIDSGYVEIPIHLSCQGIEEDCIISAQNLVIQITRGDGLIIAEKRLPYDFRQENWHAYMFKTNFYDENQYELSCLLITIEITFHQRFSRRRRRPEFKGHLNQLSRDFTALFNYFPHSNFKLKSKGPRNFFHVHSYILRARWNNFFGEPSRYTVRDDTFEIDISLKVLHQILIYMYCGEIIFPLNDHTDLDYTTELFQVIEFYRIHHLYRVFAHRDYGQVRKTFRAMLKKEYNLLLKIGDYFCSEIIVPIKGYEGYFLAKFRIQYPEGACTISYNLVSHALIDVFARVQLGLKVGQTAIRPIDQDDYFIRVATSVCSTLLTLDCDQGQENTIHFSITITDSTEIIHVENTRTNGLLPPNKSHEMLSDHMRELLNFQTDVDSRVTCRSRNPQNPDVTYPIHRGILVARLPGWRNVIKGVFGGAPEDMESFAKSDAFENILDYIYTGICPYYPLELFGEMYAFAMSAHFWPLIDRLTTIYG